MISSRDHRTLAAHARVEEHDVWPQLRWQNAAHCVHRICIVAEACTHARARIYVPKIDNTIQKTKLLA